MKNLYQQKSVIYHSLSNALSSGLPLGTMFSMLAPGFQQSSKLQHLFKSLQAQLEKGKQLHKAIKMSPWFFTPFECHLIKLGEDSGKLDYIFKLLTQYFEQLNKYRSTIINALVYPAILLLFLNFVVSIPLIFQDGFIPYIKITAMRIIIVAGVILTLKYLLEYMKLSVSFYLIMLKIPVINKLYRNIASSMFMRCLSLTYKAGLELKTCMDLSADSCKNLYFKKQINKATDLLLSGKSLQETLSSTGLFPPMVNQAISVGETTGNLEIMLDKFADYLDQETKFSIKNMMQVLWVIILLVIAVIIGYYVITSYIGIFIHTS